MGNYLSVSDSRAAVLITCGMYAMNMSRIQDKGHAETDNSCCAETYNRFSGKESRVANGSFSLLASSPRKYHIYFMRYLCYEYVYNAP